MSRLRDRRFSPANPWARKANQEWDMAECARQDGDTQAALQHTEQAREYEQQAREWEGT